MKKEVKKSKLDGLVYWTGQLALVVLSTAGLMYFLQPVEPALSYPISFTLVGCLLYISYRNR